MSSALRSAEYAIVSLSMPDGPESVLSFYRRQAGYQEVFHVDVGEARTLHIKHGASAKDVEVVVRVKGGSTRVDLLTPLH
jgi:hypothetical protein